MKKFFRMLLSFFKREQETEVPMEATTEKVYCIEVAEEELLSLKRGYVRKSLRDRLNQSCD